MSSINGAFTHTDPGLLPVLEELKRREPIFHTRAFGTSRADFEMADWLESPPWCETGSGHK
jgi:hypothetical protein